MSKGPRMVRFDLVKSQLERSIGFCFLGRSWLDLVGFCWEVVQGIFRRGSGFYRVMVMSLGGLFVGWFVGSGSGRRDFLVCSIFGVSRCRQGGGVVGMF